MQPYMSNHSQVTEERQFKPYHFSLCPAGIHIMIVTVCYTYPVASQAIYINSCSTTTIRRCIWNKTATVGLHSYLHKHHDDDNDALCDPISIIRCSCTIGCYDIGFTRKQNLG